MQQYCLRIATRGSRLALEQAARVQRLLAVPSRLVIVRTSGDRFRDAPLGEGGGIGFFTKEIEQALLDGRADLAVHSLKDLPVEPAPGLCLAAVLERDSATDLLLLRREKADRKRPFPLAAGARVGASSRRRGALLRSLRPDLELVPIRGNVPSRLEKARRGEVDALILSRAGPERLGLSIEPLLAFDLNPAFWVGAPGQGVIAVEARRDDVQALEFAASLEHAPTRLCVDLERRLLKLFGGGCHAPFGCLATVSRGRFRVRLAAPDPDGVLRVAGFSAVRAEQAETLAAEWICAGRPSQRKERYSWIARPARKWC